MLRFYQAAWITCSHISIMTLPDSLGSWNRVSWRSKSLGKANQFVESRNVSVSMNREYHRWYSPSLGRDMEMLVFGHAGARVLVFPTSQGRFFEWEDRGMMAELSDHLNQGWIQMFSVDSVDSESWYARRRHPGERAWRHVQYDRYLLDEVLPFTSYRNSNPFLMTTGASFGAYHAANFAFRHPERVGRVIGMSGLYDITRFTGGYSDGNVYFNNSCAFIKNEHDPA